MNITKATIKRIAKAHGLDVKVFSIGKSRKYDFVNYSVDMRPNYDAAGAGDGIWDKEYSRVVTAYNATVKTLIAAVEAECGVKFRECDSGWRGAEHAYVCKI